MNKKIFLFPVLFLTLSLTGCSGLTHKDDTFSAHAESMNILFFQIPGNTVERANKLVPEDAEIKTIQASPSDLTSFDGFTNRLIGVERVRISGKSN